MAHQPTVRTIRTFPIELPLHSTVLSELLCSVFVLLLVFASSPRGRYTLEVAGADSDFQISSYPPISSHLFFCYSLYLICFPCFTVTDILSRYDIHVWGSWVHTIDACWILLESCPIFALSSPRKSGHRADFTEYSGITRISDSIRVEADQRNRGQGQDVEENQSALGIVGHIRRSANFELENCSEP